MPGKAYFILPNGTPEFLSFVSRDGEQPRPISATQAIAFDDVLAALRAADALLTALAEGNPDIAVDTRILRVRKANRAAIAKAEAQE